MIAITMAEVMMVEVTVVVMMERKLRLLTRAQAPQQELRRRTATLFYDSCLARSRCSKSCRWISLFFKSIKRRSSHTAVRNASTFEAVCFICEAGLSFSFCGKAMFVLLINKNIFPNFA